MKTEIYQVWKDVDGIVTRVDFRLTDFTDAEADDVRPGEWTGWCGVNGFGNSNEGDTAHGCSVTTDAEKWNGRWYPVIPVDGFRLPGDPERLPDLFGDRYAMLVHVRDGAGDESIAQQFAQCILSGTPVHDSLREIGFKAVSNSLTELEAWYSEWVSELDLAWQSVADDAAMGDVFEAATTVVNVLHTGARLLALATVQGDVYSPIVFNFESAMSQYRGNLAEWRNAPSVTNTILEVCDELKKNRWWIQ